MKGKPSTRTSFILLSSLPFLFCLSYFLCFVFCFVSLCSVLSAKRQGGLSSQHFASFLAPHTVIYVTNYVHISAIQLGILNQEVLYLKRVGSVCGCGQTGGCSTMTLADNICTDSLMTIPLDINCLHCQIKMYKHSEVYFSGCFPLGPASRVLILCR